MSKHVILKMLNIYLLFLGMADKFTRPDFLIQFIDLYRELPCLWKVKSKGYYDRNKRHEALEKLIELCKAVCPNPTIEYVTKKIANLRTVFKKELNKIRASQKSGAGTDEVYVPRLWYYESLMFLKEEIDARASISTLQSTSATSPVPDCLSLEQDIENSGEELLTQVTKIMVHDEFYCLM